MSVGPTEPTWLASLRDQGIPAQWTGAGHCWVRFKRVAQVRYPTNDIAPLGAAERKELLWKRRSAVLQYHQLPGDEAPNAVLYLCQDRGYSLDSLTSNNRSKVRRGLKRFEVRQVTAAEVRDHGYDAYEDTLRRHGTSMMSPEAFVANWQRQLHVDQRELWGAWSGNELAAFGIVHRCGRWATISSTVSHRAHQGGYPNHALFFRMLEHLMADPVVEDVSYGLSSLRSDTARDSLHHFKTSVGLGAVPIRRQVVVHPLLRPTVNGATLRAARGAERAAPRARGPHVVRSTIEFLLGEGGDDGEQGEVEVEAEVEAEQGSADGEGTGPA